MTEMPKRLAVLPAATMRVPRHRSAQTSAERRAPASSKGYGWKWMHAARAFRREHPLCVCCQANGATSAAEVVDHVVPHRGDERLFWDARNWQSLCHWCHNNVKSALERKYDLGEVGDDALRLSRPMPEWFAPAS